MHLSGGHPCLSFYTVCRPTQNPTLFLYQDRNTERMFQASISNIRHLLSQMTDCKQMDPYFGPLHPHPDLAVQFSPLVYSCNITFALGAKFTTETSWLSVMVALCVCLRILLQCVHSNNTAEYLRNKHQCAHHRFPT